MSEETSEDTSNNSSIGDRAYAIRVAQRLSGPADAIIGYQEWLLEEVQKSGPADAVADMEKVLEAACQLRELLAGLLDGKKAVPPDAEAELRHDLRTPINAIIGYSEIVQEEFAGELSPTVSNDLTVILREARELLTLIDAIVEFSRTTVGEAQVEQADLRIAKGLQRTLEREEPAASHEPGRILVIDDMAANRDLLSRRLVSEGHAVTAVSSAIEALKLLEDASFDLALIDILMPDMNGIELLGRLKEDPRWRHMPVVMISGLTDTDAVIRCISAGAEDYLPKPVDPVLLRARINACLERARWRDRERRYVSRIEFEKERADGLIRAMLPGQIVRRLADGETVIADRFDDVTIVFADIVNFTPLVARTQPDVLLQRLAAIFSRFDEIADEFGVEKIKTIGDAYMVAAGAPDPVPDHASVAVEFARALLREMSTGKGFGTFTKLRIGIHTGPVIAGLIGRKRFVYDIWGHTVNLASRLESHGEPGRIQISQTTLDALGSRAPKTLANQVEAKGIGSVLAYLID
jgi:adenylate cyclase